MDVLNKKRRQRRGRTKISGTPEVPRGAIWRSLRIIGVQIIDDTQGKTILAVGTKQVEGLSGKSKTEQARIVGLKAAAEAQARGIERIVFDRAGYKYHGRVKAIAEGMRAGGLKF
jgi:large subunit ribosomal protein L18